MTVSERVYRALLVAYPVDHRRIWRSDGPIVSGSDET
jgi:hypothetical protein